MEGWRTQRLGDLCEIVKGRKPKLKAQASEGDFPYLVARVMRGSQEPEFASVSDRNSITVSEDETIIICDGSNSGEVFTGFRGILSSTMGKLVIKGDIDDAYLRAFLDSTFELFNGAKTGAAIPHLDKEALYALPFSYPPPTEQRRIVAILDESFEAIATAKANTEKNLQNSRELFAGHLQAVFSQQESGWIKKTVQQWVSDGVLAKPQDGNHGEIHPTKADYVDEGVPFIMAADLIDGRVDTQGCRFISRAQAEALRIGFAKTGDVLLSHKGTIGRVAILDTNDDYVILTPQVTYYRSLNRDSVFNEFLYYCLLSPEFQAAMNRIAGAGSTRAYIGITRQLDLQISLPPIEVQRTTAAQLRRIEEDSSALAVIYEARLAALDELKKSLLHQAFTGALTTKSTDKQLEAVA
jgi:type I restriction enzyme S subunit